MKNAAIALALTAATLVACSSSTDSTGSSSGSSGSAVDAAAPSGNNVVVKSNEFVPPSLTVKAGDTVTWTWEGGAHTVTSGANCTDDKSYGSALQSTVGSTFTHTFTTAGTFPYFCTPHCVSANMKGTIIVQ